ncbi:MAG: PriCT-2 domain-containing protein [Bacteroidetes bacterium]|nr:PriCT-2 domain-containing protein [Bacteroidota bacterium]
MKQKFNPEIWLVKRKPFNPEQWLNEPKKKKPKAQVPAPNYANNTHYEVDVIVQRIESHRLDLTCNYGDWFKLGVAFASEFGETGRNFFHRISRFHPDYDLTACNRQFDKCQKSGKSGVSIKSFFGAAKDAGINVFVKPQS